MFPKNESIFNTLGHNVEKQRNIPLKSCSVNTTIFLGYVWPFFIIINERVNFMIATYVMKEFKKISFAGSNSKISDFNFEHLLRNKMKYSKKLKDKANFSYILPSFSPQEIFLLLQIPL